jgi:HK97 family phage major capsid protein
MTLEKLKNDRAAAVEEMDTIVATAEAEQREITDAEQQRFDQLDASCESFTQQIKRAESLLKRKTEAAEATAAVARQATALAPVSGTPTDMSPIPATVKRWGNLKSFRGPHGDLEAYKAGMFYMAAAGVESARLWLKDHGIDIQAATQVEGVNTRGGYLVYDQLDNAIIDLRDRYGLFTRLARRVAMTSDVMIRPRRTGGLTAYFVGEDEAVTESNKDWDKVQLITKKLGVIARISNELREDAIINIADDLTGEIAWAFAKKVDECGFVGTGAQVAYGGIAGAVTRLTDVNGVDDGGGIVLGAGNLFSELTLANHVKTVSILPEYADGPRTRWICSNLYWGQVMLGLAAAAGGNTIRDLEQGGRKNFLGYPVETTPVMPTSDSNSQIACLFGDLALAADFGDRRQTTIRVSDSAVIGGNSVFERDETALIGTMRFDINVHDVGSATAAGPIVGLITAAA